MNLDDPNNLAGGYPLAKKPRPNNPPHAIFTNPPSNNNLDPNRSFPSTIPIIPGFPRLYRKFPISCAFPSSSTGSGGNYMNIIKDLNPQEEEISNMRTLPLLTEGGGGGTGEPKWSKNCDPLNLFSPRFVRGEKADREAMCPICVETEERGGEGEMKWMKVSLNYLL